MNDIIMYIEILSNFILFFMFIKFMFMFLNENGIGIKLANFTFAINIFITIITFNGRFIKNINTKNIIINIILLSIIYIVIFIHNNESKNE